MPNGTVMDGESTLVSAVTAARYSPHYQVIQPFDVDPSFFEVVNQNYEDAKEFIHETVEAYR